MRTRIPRRRSAPLTAAGLCAILIICGVAQEPPQQQTTIEQPTFRAKVNVVSVDVSVFDDDGGPITDLTTTDFQVAEDGIRQTVQTAQFIRLDGQRIAAEAESLEIRSPAHAAVEAAKEDVRLFAIYLDDYFVTRKPFITLPLRDALVDFVKQFGPRDLVAIMDPLTPLSHLRFTRSRDELLERMRAFEGRRGERFPIRSILEEGQHQHPNLAEVRSGVSLSALTSLVTYLGGLRDGRKSVIYVSEGPPIGTPSHPNYARMEEAIEAANRGNVTINVLDPRPLGSSEFGGPEVLRRLSADTGGRAIVNTNQPEKGLRQAIADASAYYLVGYTPSRELADGKFHRIDVNVKRRGVRVLARRGYWAPRAEELTPAEPPAPLEPKLSSALATFSGPSDGRIIDAWVGTHLGPDGRARVMVTWEAAARRAGTATPTRLSVEPLVRMGGDVLAPPQTIASVAAPGAEPAIASFALDPGAAAVVRLSVLAASGDVLDRWTEPVALPKLDSETVLLATPRVFRARSELELRALAANPNPVPVASRRFRGTDRVLVEIECASGDGATFPIAAELLNIKGERLLDLPIPPLSDGKTRIALPLTSLAPSVYAVRIRAGEGEREARQVVAFSVER
jgi:VWFA-related protein